MALGVPAAAALIVVVRRVSASRPRVRRRKAAARRRPPKTPKEAALVDITGYWVSIVSEDWRFRMVTAPKGDYPDVPLNAEGKKIADAWDPAKDEASGDRCKAYGAPNLMRVPARFHITWADDATLKIEIGRGHADAAHPVQRAGRHASPRSPGPVDRPVGWPGRAEGRHHNLLPGYLQSNGAPYSAEDDDDGVLRRPEGSRTATNGCSSTPSSRTRST